MQESYRRGHKGPEIQKIQKRLKELGYYKSAADGVFGPATEDAVKAFQQNNKLTSDGLVGPQTWNLMFARFKFNNHARKTGSRGDHSWFEWKVFMDEPDEKLDEVAAVEYRLHKTFPNPIRTVDERKSKFTLASAGWGEFWIYITVLLKEGTEDVTQYHLDLSKPWSD